MLVDIKSFKFFIETCEQKNISKAAKNLFISQQGLSKIISKLEKELDVTVFERTATGLELTEYGKLLKNYAETTIEQHQSFLHQIKLLKNVNKEYLSIGYAEGIFFMLPHNFMSNFMLENPEISINFKRYPDMHCEQALLNKEVDLCFCSGPYNQQLFNSLLDCKAKIYAVMNIDHPLASKDSISLFDIKSERIIALNIDTKHYKPFTEYLKTFGIIPQVFINPAEADIQFDLCSANMAIGFYSGNTEHLPKNTVLIPVRDLNVYSNFNIITLPETVVTDAMKDFTNSIRNALITGLNKDGEINVSFKDN